MKRLAVLGANTNLLPFYRQAHEYGDFYIIGIAWPEGSVCLKYCDVFYPIDFSDRERVLEICRKESIDGIISFSLESALPTLTYVVQQMGLTGNGYDCLNLTLTKFSQRQALENAGIPVPRYCKAASLDEIDIKGLPYPVIVKPVDSGGSQGICKVDCPEDLEDAFNIAVELSHSKQAIIEQYVDGREFSVEFISHRGHHHLLQITDKETSGPPHFIEMSHHQPANISIETRERIRVMVSEALTALRIKNSASHTEIKLNSNDELFIIETGARMGGDYITSDLVRLSTGYDFVRGVMLQAVGDFKDPVLPEHHHSGVYFYSKLAPEVGDVIRNSSKYSEIVECEIKEGTMAEARSNAERYGYLLYQSDKEQRFNPFHNK